MFGYVFQYTREGAKFEWTVKWDRYVMLTTLAGTQSDVAAGLAANLITENSQPLYEIVT